MRILVPFSYDLRMKKDFDTWNDKKKNIDKHKRILEFKEGEIWWSYFGMNVGEEAYGKGEDFRRPVIILKKITENSCIVIPTTTKIKEGENFYKFTTEKLERRAMLYQVKFISANRLRIKESKMKKVDFIKMKKSLANLLELSWPPSGQDGQCSDHRISPGMDIYYQNCRSCQIEAGLDEYNSLRTGVFSMPHIC